MTARMKTIGDLAQLISGAANQRFTGWLMVFVPHQAGVATSASPLDMGHPRSPAWQPGQSILIPPRRKDTSCLGSAIVFGGDNTLSCHAGAIEMPASSAELPSETDK